MRKILLQHLGIAVLISLATIAAFGLAGMQPKPLWFVGAGLAIAFVTLALRLATPLVLETSWPSRQDEKFAESRAASRNNDNRTQFLATWVQESDRERRAGEGSQTFARRIRPLLLDLTTDRLVHRHGIDPEQEPDRARDLLGDQVWTLITSTEARTATFAEIEQAVATIEKL